MLMAGLDIWRSTCFGFLVMFPTSIKIPLKETFASKSSYTSYVMPQTDSRNQGVRNSNSHFLICFCYVMIHLEGVLLPLACNPYSFCYVCISAGASYSGQGHRPRYVSPLNTSGCCVGTQTSFFLASKTSPLEFVSYLYNYIYTYLKNFYV